MSAFVDHRQQHQQVNNIIVVIYSPIKVIETSARKIENGLVRKAVDLLRLYKLNS